LPAGATNQEVASPPATFSIVSVGANSTSVAARITPVMSTTFIGS
jgi:hypothetical protein